MDSPPQIAVKPCYQADREHRRSKRSYAHTFHRSGVICVARSFYSLPLEHYWAILAHEVGHLLAGAEGSEEDADALADTMFGVSVQYRDTKYGEALQTVTTEEAMSISRQFTFIFNYDPIHGLC